MDPAAPFAFLVTYTTRLSAKGAPQHRPLGHALEESRQSRDRDRLLALLQPVQRASDKSALVHRLVESGEIYQPLAWTASQAHAFLKELPIIEGAGVLVRVPDWWNRHAPPRARVRVSLGTRPPSVLGAGALLDNTTSLALDGEPLTEA